jgi:hypothetical protein
LGESADPPRKCRRRAHLPTVSVGGDQKVAKTFRVQPLMLRLCQQ